MGCPGGESGDEAHGLVYRQVHQRAVAPAWAARLAKRGTLVLAPDPEVHDHVDPYLEDPDRQPHEPALEARHRAHAGVEDGIRCAKSTGLAHLPSRQLNVNTVWVELVGLACDLLAWTRLLLLDGTLATAEPKQLRCRLLRAAVRLVRSGRRLHLRIDRNWPWKDALVTAFTRRPGRPLTPAHGPPEIKSNPNG